MIGGVKLHAVSDEEVTAYGSLRRTSVMFQVGSLRASLVTSCSEKAIAQKSALFR
jgi:hypothetical protein